jgi:hypothetical protein
MRKAALAATSLIALVCSVSSAAQETPGVTQIAPGVRRIDGSQVPSVEIDRPALEAALIRGGAFRDVRRMLGGSGIESPGPAGTVTHMYKVRDRATAEELVLIVFVKGRTIVDSLLT